MKVGILMDPIDQIQPQKDTSFAMLLEVQARGGEIYYMESQDIWLQDGICWGQMRLLRVEDNAENWFYFTHEVVQPLVDLDVLLMRKDPPFSMEYIYLTYLLEQAEAQGLVVINGPRGLRDANEKLFTAWFPQCCPKTMVSSQLDLLRDFVSSEEEVVVKPLGVMGGASVFRVKAGDPNLNVILETVTDYGAHLVMAQRFIPEVQQGDKRILMINGDPVRYGLARIPAEGDFRGNIACGATIQGVELNDHDYWICEQVSATLVEKKLIFVGLDIIGDYLTEINVTSPTCVREIEAIFNVSIASDFFDCVEEILSS